MPKPTTPGAGKPTPQQLNSLVTLRQGNHPLPLICQALKLKTETVEQWLQQGREAKPGTDLHTFSQDYDAADALGIISLRKSLADHAKTNPEAALKLLELHAKDKEAPPEGSQQLDNHLKEHFVQLMSGGMKQGDAYQKAFGCPKRSADASAARLLATVSEVKTRLRYLQRQSAGQQALTREDRLKTCLDVRNSATASHRDKLAAVKLDAELKGELIGKTDLTSNGEALPAVLPPIIINLPERFTRQRGSGKPV